MQIGEALTMKVRIRIREQLCLLITRTTLLALVILAVSTWVQTSQFMRSARSETLRVTANLKDTQIAQDIDLLRSSVQSVSTRDDIQYSVRDFNNGNRSEELFKSMEVSTEDLWLTRRSRQD